MERTWWRLRLGLKAVCQRCLSCLICCEICRCLNQLKRALSVQVLALCSDHAWQNNTKKKLLQGLRDELHPPDKVKTWHNGVIKKPAITSKVGKAMETTSCLATGEKPGKRETVASQTHGVISHRSLHTKPVDICVNKLHWYLRRTYLPKNKQLFEMSRPQIGNKHMNIYIR